LLQYTRTRDMNLNNNNNNNNNNIHANYSRVVNKKPEKNA